MRQLIFAYKFSTGRDVYRATPDATTGFRVVAYLTETLSSYLHLFKLNEFFSINVYLNFMGLLLNSKSIQHDKE